MGEHAQAPLKKPTVYDELYPGRFLKAGEFLGRKVQLTIADVEHERLMGDNNKEELKVIISFRETQKKLVACKTNGFCLKEMFGKTLANWIGKRVILFPDNWNGEPAIRVWGSPDIPEEMEITVKLPRRLPMKKVMHTSAGNGKAKASAPKPVATDDEPPMGALADDNAPEPGSDG